MNLLLNPSKKLDTTIRDPSPGESEDEECTSDNEQKASPHVESSTIRPQKDQQDLLETVLETWTKALNKEKRKNLDLVKRNSTVSPEDARLFEDIISSFYEMRAFENQKVISTFDPFKTIVLGLMKALDQAKDPETRESFVSIFKETSPQSIGKNEMGECSIDVRVMRDGLHELTFIYKKAENDRVPLQLLRVDHNIIQIEVFILRLHPNFDSLATMAMSILKAYDDLFPPSNLAGNA